MLQVSQFLPANYHYIQYFGRWDRTDGLRPKHSRPGVYITLKFTGTSLCIRMTDNVHYYNVYIDGKFYGIVHGDQPGETDDILADSLKGGPHTCRFSKGNRSFDYAASVSGFLLDDEGQLLPPAPTQPPRSPTGSSAFFVLATCRRTEDAPHTFRWAEPCPSGTVRPRSENAIPCSASYSPAG